jgi:hypothetical protein
VISVDQAVAQALDARARAERAAADAAVATEAAVRSLHAAGQSMRTIAGQLGLSHQRVHQILRQH